MNCAFCPQEGAVPYTCPKCHAPYCSLKCYQSQTHVNCSEKFYKGEVEGELLARASEDKRDKDKVNRDRKNMLEALQRLDEQNDLDSDEDDLDLQERMAGVNLDDFDSVWGKLSKEEREEFERMVESGKIRDVLPDFVPFWALLPRKKKVLIQELSEDEDDREKELVKSCPKVLTDIPKFDESDKTAKKWIPSLLNVLYAYCYAVRHFMGEHADEDNILAFAEVMVNLSDDLTEFDPEKASQDASLAVERVIFFLKSGEFAELAEDNEHYDLVKEDLKKLVQGPSDDESGFYILSALSDLKNCLEKGLKKLLEYSEDKGDVSDDLNDWKVSSSSLVDRKRPISIEPTHLKLAAKRTSYFLSMVTHSNHLLHPYRI